MIAVIIIGIVYLGIILCMISWLITPKEQCAYCVDIAIDTDNIGLPVCENCCNVMEDEL